MNATEQNKKSNANANAMLANAADAEAREKLMNDMRSVIYNAQEWLSNASGQTGEDLRAVKEKIQTTLRDAKNNLQHLQDTAIERGRHAAQVTDTYVNENPWKSVGIGAAVGIAVGFLLSRKQ